MDHACSPCDTVAVQFVLIFLQVRGMDNWQKLQRMFFIFFWLGLVLFYYQTYCILSDFPYFTLFSLV
jgi:hypothetical protein